MEEADDTDDDIPKSALKAKKRKRASAKEPTPPGNADRAKRKKITNGSGSKRDKTCGVPQGKDASSSQGLSSSRLASYGLVTEKKKKKKRRNKSH